MKIVTPAQAVVGIRSGDQIYVQCAAAAPSALLDALVARASELEDVGVIHLHIEGPGPHLAPDKQVVLTSPGLPLSWEEARGPHAVTAVVGQPTGARLHAAIQTALRPEVPAPT